VATPGANDKEEEREGRVEEEQVVYETRRRTIAARANCLAQDRMDIQLAAKEIGRFTSKPEPDWQRVKRLGRDLKDLFHDQIHNRR
jgi:hypothetical protein